ncbi:ABC-2 transporter permease [Mahella australiensis]|uniref:ABC-2 type transporter n=1 Tax=Mahella australiensis (strain DSM 15567 / CIP 107919 / 50-1 BON) TaxID=697281 RepID=F4A3D2_MAHA5|nr:ABC-2 transporter permease [Mahella australiensis]AEE97387.1 hypothetical protein Mahau_2216 [Mahella australiensis 50-1 BON]
MIGVYKKELKAYFSTPTGYVFMGFFLLIAGFFFAISNLFPMVANYNGMLSNLTFIFLIVVPILTMRLMAEEMRQKTDVLLLTSPLSVNEMVLGKYFAAVTVFLITLLITCLYPLMMSFFGDIAVWEIIGGYVGFFLLGSTFIAVGLFISSLTDNQVIAAVVTFSVLLLLWVIDALQSVVPTDIISGVVFASALVAAVAIWLYSATRNIYVSLVTAIAGGAAIAGVYIVNKDLYTGFIGKVLAWFSVLNRYNEFSLGILSLSPIVYYITFSAVFVFLAIRNIEKKRWS